MKLKSFIAVAAIVMLAGCETTYQATDTGTLIVPAETERIFVEQYPGSTNVVWSRYDPSVVILNDWELTGWQTMDASDYVVRFDVDNEPYYAWYDTDGTWIGTAYVVKDHTKLPVTVTNTLNTSYPSYTILSANREYYRDRMLYEVAVRKTDGSKVVMLVDGNGTIVKQKVKD